VPVRAQVVASGLEVPWGLGFLPGGDLLITERPGRVRLVTAGTLVEEPVARVRTTQTGEGGLLGIAIDPGFASNRGFFLFLTVTDGDQTMNQVERWTLSEDHRSALFTQLVVAGIAGAAIHDGGRLRIGPDGKLWVTTGDARQSELAQDPQSLNGKLLRYTLEGKVPSDNPQPGSPVFLLGLRNSEGFDWFDPQTLAVVDHGPSGERLRFGNDEVNVAHAGENLGWPTLYGCQTKPGLVTPRLAFERAVHPGGAAFYRGVEISDWSGSLLIGTLGSRHLHRVVFDPFEPHEVTSHEVYFQGDPPQGLGRLREVMMGPDRQLYVTTSNCDGRGTCPPEGDQVLRIVPAP
jgi:glucose/arabinose dehydrogenase